MHVLNYCNLHITGLILHLYHISNRELKIITFCLELEMQILRQMGIYSNLFISLLRANE